MQYNHHLKYKFYSHFTFFFHNLINTIHNNKRQDKRRHDLTRHKRETERGGEGVGLKASS